MSSNVAKKTSIEGASSRGVFHHITDSFLSISLSVSLSFYIHKYIYIYVYVYKYICRCICICKCICICICVCMYVCMYLCMYVCMYGHLYFKIYIYIIYWFFFILCRIYIYTALQRFIWLSGLCGSTGCLKMWEIPKKWLLIDGTYLKIFEHMRIQY